MNKLLLAVLVASLGACATSSPDVVHPYQAQRMSQVLDATVLSVRPVTVDGSQSGVGAGAGAVVGGVAGASAIGHSGSPESVIGGVLGAVVGGVIGNAAERGATRENAVELLVQMRNGERRAIVQARGAETFVPGDPVMLITTDGRTRVTHAPGVAPAPAAYPAPAAPPAAYPAPAAYPPRTGYPVPPAPAPRS